MKYTKIASVMAAAVLLMAAAAPSEDKLPTSNGDLTIHPVRHATMVLSWNGKTIYVDPAPASGSPPGSDAAADFQGMAAPDLILVTDIHGDHFNAPTLEKVAGADTVIVAPKAVFDKMPDGLKAKTQVLANGETKTVAGVGLEGVPMYNLTEDRLKFHDKGRGNGYVLTVGGKRVYIAGDTEDVPEMRALQNIDAAFIPMNLPYTMPPAQAAEGVLAFKPKVVYPYHYGKSDLAEFTGAIPADSGIEVRLLKWY